MNPKKLARLFSIESLSLNMHIDLCKDFPPELSCLSHAH